MKLTSQEEEMLDGRYGRAVKKSMEILTALGEIYRADELIDIKSVQISGVSYENLGEPGLEFLEDMAEDGRSRVITTLNPAGMDLENWRELGIDPIFAENQNRVIKTYEKMNIITTCTCTPYLIGNLPLFGEHIAWSESSAICYANSVLGARTNREGGPSALASALTGKTAKYGFHIKANRRAEVTVKVAANLSGTYQFGALGKAVGCEIRGKIPYISGISTISLEELKSFCASIATYGGTALFHMEKITPEYKFTEVPGETIDIGDEEISEAINELTDENDIDFVNIGCPHCSIRELAKIAELLKGKKVKKDLWITTSRPVKGIAERMGYVKIIEDAGAKFACDTCCIVAPIKHRFKTFCTDSAKGCYYFRGKHQAKTRLASLEECIGVALR